MTAVKYNVPNISCGHCVHTIQMEVGDLEGVQSVKASNETKEVEGIPAARLQYSYIPLLFQLPYGVGDLHPLAQDVEELVVDHIDLSPEVAQFTIVFRLLVGAFRVVPQALHRVALVRS